MEKKTEKKAKGFGRVNFGKLVRGFIRCHPDRKNGRFPANPNDWIASEMDMTPGTINTYLANPRIMGQKTRAYLKMVLRQRLDCDGCIDAMDIIVDSIPKGEHHE